MRENKELLNVNDLIVQYVSQDETVHAVNKVSFNLFEEETIGLVGETGAGKTTIALSIMGLISDPPGKITNGEIFYNDLDLRKFSQRQMRKVRGKEISMIFQDPMTSLNPIDSVGDQITEVIKLHERVSRITATKKAMEMLELVGIPSTRYSDYPHQFSGGMQQRIDIAIALACNPKLLIADEPTTALDVTIQAQILEMIENLKKRLKTSIILITHDLGIVAKMCDRVFVIYAGEIVESGNLIQIFDQMNHPYTIGLFGSLPNIAQSNLEKKKLNPIPGLMPDPTNLPIGCKFFPRCKYKESVCDLEVQSLIEVDRGHLVRCWKHQEVMGAVSGVK